MEGNYIKLRIFVIQKISKRNGFKKSNSTLSVSLKIFLTKYSYIQFDTDTKKIGGNFLVNLAALFNKDLILIKEPVKDGNAFILYSILSLGLSSIYIYLVYL